MCSVVARGRGRSGVEHSTNGPSFSGKFVTFLTMGLLFTTYPAIGTYPAGHFAEDTFVAASFEGTVTAYITIDTNSGVHFIGFFGHRRHTFQGPIIGTDPVENCIEDPHKVTVVDYYKVTVIGTGPFVEDSSVGSVTAVFCIGYFIKDFFAAGFATGTDFAVYVAKSLPR